MDIRPFQPANEAAVVSLWMACDLVRPWNDPRKDIARKLQMQPELFLVGAEDEKIVGTVMVGYEGHRGWINYLAVSPEQQGRGLGRELMEEAETRLRALGCPKINLQVRTGNPKVRAFYEAIGYTLDEVVSFGKRLESDDS
ncbi:GNAT family acetyltransferase [soil metagenome]